LDGYLSFLWTKEYGKPWYGINQILGMIILLQGKRVYDHKQNAISQFFFGVRTDYPVCYNENAGLLYIFLLYLYYRKNKENI